MLERGPHTMPSPVADECDAVFDVEGVFRDGDEVGAVALPVGAFDFCGGVFCAVGGAVADEHDEVAFDAEFSDRFDRREVSLPSFSEQL